LLDAETRSATATTERETVLLRLDQDAIYELMNDRIEIAQSIIRILCARIRDLDRKYVEIETRGYPSTL
jgi:CRP-like cAMP-binding protein